LARKVFLSLDPISSMHLGLSNNKDQQYRAELLSHFILRKVPNTLIQDEDGKEFFERKRESEKLEFSKSQKMPQKRKLKNKHKTVPAPADSDGEDEGEKDGFGELGRTKPALSKERTETLTRVHSKVIHVEDSAVRDFDSALVGDRTPKMSYDDAAVITDPTATVETVCVDVTRRVSVDRRRSQLQQLVIEDLDGPGAVEHRNTTHETATVTAAVSPHPPVAVETARAKATRRASMERMSSLPALQPMFCDPEKFLAKSTGLSLVDSVAVYAYITQAGCETTEDLLLTLKEAKQHRRCSCSRNSNADAGSAAHAEQCSSRRAGVWADALTNVGVPYFHAIKIVRALRSYL
jgi:hypothetical protein